MKQNIVTAWVMYERETYGHNQTQALQGLNTAMGTNYAEHRLSEWKGERRSLPPVVANFMLRGAVAYVQEHPKAGGLMRLPVPKRTCKVK